MLKDYLIGEIDLSAKGLLAADVNKDGLVDSIDYYYIKKHMIGEVGEFPVEQEPIDEEVNVSIASSVYGRNGDIVIIPIQFQKGEVPSEGISTFGFH